MDVNSELHLFLARARAHDLRAAAAAGEAARLDGEAPRIPPTSPVTLRFAFEDDGDAIARLAALDSSDPPPMPILLGEVGGQLRAAMSLADGAVVADPFHPTAALVELLHARARQLHGGASPLRGVRLRIAALRLRSAPR